MEGAINLLKEKSGAGGIYFRNERRSDWYEDVLVSNCEPMKRIVMIFKEKQTKILNRFVYSYINGFVEGLKNKTKVIKRAAYGYGSFNHFR